MGLSVSFNLLVLGRETPSHYQLDTALYCLPLEGMELLLLLLLPDVGRPSVRCEYGLLLLVGEKSCFEAEYS